MFFEDISAPQRREGVKRSSSLFKLNPVLQDGILRVGGRLSRSTLPEESKQPETPDKNLHVTKLILREIHENLCHSGRNHVLSKLQTKYWIPSANSAIRRVLSKCAHCFDNGTNFVGAERELKRAIREWNISKIEKTLHQNGIQ